MTDRTFSWVIGAVAFYIAGAIVCFGPATVQSERARDNYQAKCRAESAGDKSRIIWCPRSGPMAADGAAKAFFWPLWISYTLASKRDADCEK